MTKTLTLLLTALVLASCATASDPKPAVCDGKHRRPANPYGSVLSTTPAPAAAQAPPAPGPRSALDPQSFDQCGATA